MSEQLPREWDFDEEPPARSGATRVIALVLALLLVGSIGVVRIFDAFSDETEIEVGDSPADVRGFKFLGRDPATGEPVRYDPCTEIRYVVNPAGAPPNGIDDIHAAFRLTADITGMSFVYEGDTDEVPGRRRDIYQPERYGKRWAPLLIGWLPNDPAVFAEHGAGVGGSAAVPNEDGELVYVTGSITLNSSRELQPGFNPGRTWGKVILHELGHVLGLDHVHNPAQVMNESLVTSPATWGPGDLIGLRELGRLGGCIKPPVP